MTAFRNSFAFSADTLRWELRWPGKDRGLRRLDTLRASSFVHRSRLLCTDLDAVMLRPQSFGQLLEGLAGSQQRMLPWTPI